MAENILKLKKRALAAGMDRKVAVKATREDFEKFLAKNEDSKPVAKKKSKSKDAPAVKSTKKKGKAKRRPKVEEESKPKRGRPKGTTTKKASPAKKKATESTSGRSIIGKLDYVNFDPDLWKPHAGSTVSVIWKSLKKHKDNVEKVFEDLKGDIWDYVSKKKDNGEKRSKAEAEALLKFKINQTRWRFGIQTGQHEKSEDRIEYGTGPHAQTRKKPKRKVKREESKAPERKNKTKTKTKKSPTKATGKKRGRPLGSKNKSKK